MSSIRHNHKSRRHSSHNLNKPSKTKSRNSKLDIINPSLNLSIYKNLFQTQGIISVPNFLESKFADKIYHFLTKDMTDEWWYNSSFHGKDKVIIPNLEENKEEIKESMKKAQEKFSDNEFSYCFYRTYKNHFPECDCLECHLRKLVSSKAFIDVINEITGLKLEKNNELFLSKYSSECFLNVHNDQGNGKIAMVINMTKHWKPQYGGNFYLLTNDRKGVRRVLTPVFNSLNIFRIPEPNGIPHYVSHVVPGIKSSRYAISGWFS